MIRPIRGWAIVSKEFNDGNAFILSDTVRRTRAEAIDVFAPFGRKEWVRARRLLGVRAVRVTVSVTGEQWDT